MKTQIERFFHGRINGMLINNEKHYNYIVQIIEEIEIITEVEYTNNLLVANMQYVLEEIEEHRDMKEFEDKIKNTSSIINVILDYIDKYEMWSIADNLDRVLYR